MLYRIVKALKESENYSQPITGNGNLGRNRRTVVRMQSKLNILIGTHYFINWDFSNWSKDKKFMHFVLFSGSHNLFSSLLDSLSCPTDNVYHFDSDRKLVSTSYEDSRNTSYSIRYKSFLVGH